MTYVTLLDNEWLTVCYHPTDKYIHHTIHKSSHGETLREALDTGFKALSEHGFTKWLSDDRNNDELLQEDVEYALNIWGPRMAEVGWRYWALVVPESIASRASMQQVVEIFYDLNVKVSVFSDLDDAREWLISC